MIPTSAALETMDGKRNQDGSSVTGDSIDYFITEQLVKAESDKETEGNRVRVVIEPQVLREEEDKEQADSGDTAGN